MSKSRLLLVAGMVFVVALAFGESQEAKKWGLSTQVSNASGWIDPVGVGSTWRHSVFNLGQWLNASGWIGGVFNLGQRFMIRPGLWEFVDYPNYFDFGLKADFLFTGKSRERIFWYVGPSVLVIADLNFTQLVGVTEIPAELNFDIEIALKAGIQAMIFQNVGFFTDVGFYTSGNIYSSGSSSSSEGTFYGFGLRGYGLGVVVYVK